MHDLPPEAAYWDGRYRSDGRLWGDGPSELARLAVARLETTPLCRASVLSCACWTWAAATGATAATWRPSSRPVSWG